MKRALIKIVDDREEGHSYPKNEVNSRYVSKDVVRDHLRTVKDWGFDAVVLVGDDCFQHPDFWDIYDYADDLYFNSIKMMSRGRYLRMEEFRDIFQKGVEVILPIDLHNPFESGEIFGFQNYTDEASRVMNRLRDCEVWMSPIGSNMQNCFRTVQNCMRTRTEWRGVTAFPNPTNPGQPPNEALENLGEQENVEIWGLERFVLVHYDINDLGEWPVNREDIFGWGNDMSGTMYVDADGFVRPPHVVSEEKFGPLNRMEREDLRELSELLVEDEEEDEMEDVPDADELLSQHGVDELGI